MAKIFSDTMPLPKYKNLMAKTAKELCYGDKVINDIMNAAGVNQIANIMNRARRACIEQDIQSSLAIKKGA